jgi:hypothetical protein
MKFDPFMVRINPELPAPTEDGLRDRIEGAGLEVALMVNAAEPEPPPPGGGLVTLISAEPELVMSAAVICTWSWVLEV